MKKWILVLGMAALFSRSVYPIFVGITNYSDIKIEVKIKTTTEGQTYTQIILPWEIAKFNIASVPYEVAVKALDTSAYVVSAQYNQSAPLAVLAYDDGSIALFTENTDLKKLIVKNDVGRPVTVTVSSSKNATDKMVSKTRTIPTNGARCFWPFQHTDTTIVIKDLYGTASSASHTYKNDVIAEKVTLSSPKTEEYSFSVGERIAETGLLAEPRIHVINNTTKSATIKIETDTWDDSQTVAPQAAVKYKVLNPFTITATIDGVQKPVNFKNDMLAADKTVYVREVNGSYQLSTEK